MQNNFKINSTFSIEGKKVGINQPCFIIAEIGVNHNGNLNLAKEHILKAKECGADAAKFQSFDADEFMADKNLVYEYENNGQLITEKMYNMFKRLELKPEWHEELFQFCRNNNIIPLTSTADTKSIDLVKRLNIGALKLSSEDLINLPLVEYAAKTRLPLIFSTGMANEEEITDVLKILKKYDCRNIIFLHCVSVYPTPIEETNLKRMIAIRNLINGPVGYSDHTTGIDAANLAVAMGACIIEKHFTIDKTLKGPDHILSSDPKEFKALVNSIRSTEARLGLEQITASKTEEKTKLDFRRSIVTNKPLSKGHIISENDLALKRPGTGLRARDKHLIVGKKLTRDLKNNEQILLKYIQA